MRRIVLPQVARVIVPPLGNELNDMMKNASLVHDQHLRALRRRREIYSQVLSADFFLGIAFWYLVLTTVWAFIQA